MNQKLESDTLPKVVVGEIVSLWQHQKNAIELALKQRDFGILFEMGTGKSLTVINILRHRFAEYRKILRTLIVSPPITLENWRREWERGSKVGDKVVVAYGTKKKRLEAIGSKPIVITNYESLIMPEVFQKLWDWCPEIIVFDESQKAKDYRSKRTKAAVKLSTCALHRYILTGTPILNSPVDIFTQFQALDCGETFGNNFYAFRNRYLYDANAHMPRDRHFPNWKIRPGALEEINALIYKKAMRVTKDECLDLPPLVKETVFVEMSPEQRRAYEEMKKDFITYVRDKACVATIALTKALKLMQITTGFVAIDDETKIDLDNAPRISALKELLEVLTPHHKVIVWAVFKQNYAAIRKVCDSLKIQYVEVHGEISSSQKFAAVDQFNTMDSTRVFIGHPGSGGIGINLTSSDYTIYYSRNFSLENDIQSESRNHRGGSERHKKITRIDIVAKDTIDEAITKALASKLDISEKVLRDLSLEL